jgi:antitoxin CcdA
MRILVLEVAMNAQSARRATNISLSAALLEEARGLGINVSRACERGLAGEIAEVRAQLWGEKNREAIASSNDWVERNGLPLAQYRQF